MKKILVNMVSESEFTVKGHGVHTAYVELTQALRRRKDVDVVTYEQGRKADITHLHTVGLYALGRLLFGSGKKVVSAHIVPDSFIGSVALAKHWTWFARIYLKWFYGRADMVLAVSQTVARELNDSMHISSRVEMLYNTIDMTRYRPSLAERAAARKVLAIRKNAFVVVSSGQIQPRKRFDVMVKLACALPDIEFIWIGGIPFKHLGASYDEMQRLVKSRPANMRVTDVIPNDEVPKYLRAADVFILPSDQENHPMSVLEAAGAELPIILRDIPEYDDTFTQDALRGDDETFMALIERLKRDKKFYEAARSGSRKIAERFDSESGAARAVVLYRELLEMDEIPTGLV